MAYKRISPQPVNEGGTGQITNTAHGILLGQGTNPITSQTLTNGQLLIGSTGLDPVSASLTSTNSTITVTPGAGSIDLITGPTVATSYATDAGNAVPALGVLTVAGGTNLNSAGAGSTVTLNLDTNLTAMGTITTNTAGALQTGTTAGDTTLLKAYNNTTAGYDTFGTLTANLVPTFDLGTTTTIGGNYIYRAGGTDIPVTDGGTGVSTLTTPYGVLCAGTTATGPVQTLASLGSATQVLTSNGAGALPSWQDATGGITTLNGDTGSATGATVTFNANSNAGKSVKFTGSGATMSLIVTDPILGNTTIGLNSGFAGISGAGNTALGTASLIGAGTAGSNTAIGYGSMGAITSGSSNIALGYDSLNLLTTGNNNISIGNTNVSYTTNESSNILIQNAGVITESNVLRIGTTGSGARQQNKCYIAGIQGVNVGSVATVVSYNGDQLGGTTITAGSGISVTPGANTITIANTGSAGIVWSAVTVDATFTVNTGTIANKAGLLTMTLPATAALGDIIEITNINTAVGWRIAQNANQYIRYGSSLTTTGVGGYLEATQLGDSAKLLCVVAGASTGWQVLANIGNLTVV